MLISKIDFKKYKKLVNISLDFKPNINAIFGTNATCKTSILHIISNTYQTITTPQTYLNDQNCLKIINKINLVTNPKIETLNRGDTRFNDPAPNHTGTLFECHLNDSRVIPFRRHNSSNNKRYRVIPNYRRGQSESLPFACIVYLGLSRLSSYGEFLSDEQISLISGSYAKLPESYKTQILTKYRDFTTYHVENIDYEEVLNVKRRARFSTDHEGSDSNTISAGEDNLMIILTAIYSLVYFCNSLKDEHKHIPAILLVDELDATLHPEYQIKLLELLRSFTTIQSNFQVVFTSHSISLLEECHRCRDNVIYLINNLNHIGKLEEPDPYIARAMLENKLNRNIYANRLIPVLLEDEEARVFFKQLLRFFIGPNRYNISCPELSHLTVIDDTSFSSSTLLSLFGSSSINRSILPFICCVDGDSNENITNSIIKLPGNDSPEAFIFEYLKKVITETVSNEEYREFWQSAQRLYGYTIYHVQTQLLPKINDIQNRINLLHERNVSAKGVLREERKKIFNEYKEFFTMLFTLWINDECNKESIMHFYKNLLIVSVQNSEFNKISSSVFKEVLTAMQ